jgi:uncharacterized membrane protein YesL
MTVLELGMGIMFIFMVISIVILIAVTVHFDIEYAEVEARISNYTDSGNTTK